MSKEVHLYMAGNDPFVMPVGDTVFYIHTGLPGASDVPSTPPGASDTPAPATASTVTPVPISAPIRAINIPGLYADFTVSPATADEVRHYLEDLEGERDTVGLALTGGGEEQSRGPADQLASIIAGVGRSGRDDLTVHVVPAEGAGSDG